jgi:hypothetical protein
MCLVITNCAKPDEYSDWLMLGIQSMYPMVVWDPMEKFKKLASLLALTSPIHHLEVCHGHGCYPPTIQVHVEG